MFDLWDYSNIIKRYKSTRVRQSERYGHVYFNEEIYVVAEMMADTYKVSKTAMFHMLVALGAKVFIDMKRAVKAAKKRGEL